MKVKSIILAVSAVILLLATILLFTRTMTAVSTPPVTTESFSNALWNNWGVSIVIIAFIIFAGGASILVLLGGGWRWE